MRRKITAVLALLAALALPAAAHAQQRVTLREAVDAALANGSRLRVAAADEAIARAAVTTARAFPNPTANLTYSKATPQYHAVLDQPLEFPWLRSARIQAALAGGAAARYRLEVERAAVRFAVDSTYLAAAAAGELARLSARDARAGDELVRIAQTRESAGDASELDVELARVTQGGLANTALADSLSAVAALLDLQVLMGLPGGGVEIALADSLAGIAPAVGTAAGSTVAADQAAATPLRVAAAEADLAAQQATLVQERASRFAAPSVTAGVEWHDPTGGEPGYLPTFGLAIPLPIFDRNRGGIATARASQDRARAQLDAARRDQGVEMARARLTCGRPLNLQAF
ncbi:MAG: outer rane efflux protein, partial [Gemmatimonadetes bacterium]|nr:outer rane efflux protein [Gemmatimonadota bacterium]